MITLENKDIEIIEVKDNLAFVNVYKSTSHADKDLFPTYIDSEDILGANVVNYSRGQADVNYLEHGRRVTFADYVTDNKIKMFESGSYLVEKGWLPYEEEMQHYGKESILAAQRLIRQQAKIIDTPNYLERPIVYSLRIGGKGYFRIFKAFYSIKGHYWVDIAANTIKVDDLASLLEEEGMKYEQDKEIINQLNEANKIIILE